MTQQNTDLKFDLYYNENDELVLFCDPREGEPANPSITLHKDANTFTLTRNTNDTVKGEIKTDEAREAMQKESKITVIELDLVDPEKIQTYVLDINREA